MPFARLINVNWKRTAVTSQHATLTLLCLFKGLLSMYFAASDQSYCQNKQREYFNMLPADYSFSYWLKFKAMIDSWKGKKTYQTTAYCEFSSCSLKKKKKNKVMLYLILRNLWCTTKFTAICGNGLLINAGYLTVEKHRALLCKHNHNPCSVCAWHISSGEEILSDPWRLLSCKYLWCGR